MGVALAALALGQFAGPARPDGLAPLATQNVLAASNVEIAGPPGGQIGLSVAAAGDINGDGFPDIALGAPLLSVDGRRNAGGVFVVFGGRFHRLVSLASLAPTDGFRIIGARAGDMAGYAVTSGGDLNGDGRDDLVLGAPFATRRGRVACGATYVIFGANDIDHHKVRHGGLPRSTATVDLAALGNHGVEIDGANTGDEAGFSVAATPPTGTRIGELVVGAPYRSAGGQNLSGAAYVLREAILTEAAPRRPIDLSELTSDAGFRIDGKSAGDLTGYAVAGAPDVNGDGLPDFVIGAPGAEDSRGAAFVVFNRESGEPLSLEALAVADGVRYDGVADGGGAGEAVGVVPAVQVSDATLIMIGAPLAAVKAGITYILPFQATPGAVSLQDATIKATGQAPGDELGFSLSASVWANPSGATRIALAGAPGASPSGREGAGEVAGMYVDKVSGSISPGDLPADQGFTLTGALDGDQAGASVAGNNNFNQGTQGAVALVGAPHAELETDPLAGAVLEVPNPPVVATPTV